MTHVNGSHTYIITFKLVQWGLCAYTTRQTAKQV